MGGKLKTLTLTDLNGQVIEELMDERELVCMSDGRGTRITAGTESVLSNI